jgi:Glu-tRNA(Gln) amidotransferase subunit E-like FAD-binding protein
MHDYKPLTTLVAVTLTEELKKLERDGVDIETLSDDAIRGTFELVASGELVKESVPSVLIWLAKNPTNPAKAAISALGLGILSEAQLASIVEAKIMASVDLVEKMGEKAAGPIMGFVMGEIRGKAKAADVQAMIAAKLKAALTK